MQFNMSADANDLRIQSVAYKKDTLLYIIY